MREWWNSKWFTNYFYPCLESKSYLIYCEEGVHLKLYRWVCECDSIHWDLVSKTLCTISWLLPLLTMYLSPLISGQLTYCVRSLSTTSSSYDSSESIYSGFFFIQVNESSLSLLYTGLWYFYLGEVSRVRHLAGSASYLMDLRNFGFIFILGVF